MNNNHQKYVRSNEPIVWSLFGAGGMVSAFFLPAVILVILLVSLGLLDVNLLSYERVQLLYQSLIGKILLITVISLSTWHGMHRIYHGLFDLGQRTGRTMTFYLCYGFALLVTIVGTVICFS